MIRTLKDIGYAGWVCNELDSWPDPIGAARESHAFVTAQAAKGELGAGSSGPQRQHIAI